MSLASYDIQGQYASSVVVPSAGEQPPDEQKRLFYPGLHGCPACQARELQQMGRDNMVVVEWLLNASQRQRLCSEKNEQVTAALYRANLLSDSRLREDLEVNFHVQSKPYGTHQTRRRAGYNHLPGKNRQCAADDEHDAVIGLIRLHLEIDLEKRFPGSRIEWLENKRIDPRRQRPDLQAQVYVDTCLIEHLAIEVQKSRISLDAFQARHQALTSVTKSVVWLFKKRGLSGVFRPCIEWALGSNVNMGSYHINDKDQLEIQPLLTVPEKRPASPQKLREDELCTRLNYVEEAAQRRDVPRSVSLHPKVLGDLSFMHRGHRLPPRPDFENWDSGSRDKQPLVAYSSYLGIPPWQHH